jgi:hypothetical protein
VLTLAWRWYPSSSDSSRSKKLPNKSQGDAHKETRGREFTSDQKGKGNPLYLLKRMAALTPPKPAEIERAIVFPSRSSYRPIFP